jgi:hypothetical protein
VKIVEAALDGGGGDGGRMGWGRHGQVLVVGCLPARGAGAAGMRASGGWGAFCPLSLGPSTGRDCELLS